MLFTKQIMKMKEKDMITKTIFKLSMATTLCVVGSAVLIQNSAQACSRVLWNTQDNLVIAGRSMDWQHKFDDWMFVNPRGQIMTGGDVKNAVKWTSKYGSIVTTVSSYAEHLGFDWVKDGATDGINEKGFTAHLLFLEESRYPAVDDRPALSYMRWVRYLLDNYATVEEAIAGQKTYK